MPLVKVKYYKEYKHGWEIWNRLLNSCYTVKCDVTHFMLNFSDECLISYVMEPICMDALPSRGQNYVEDDESYAIFVDRLLMI